VKLGGMSLPTGFSWAMAGRDKRARANPATARRYVELIDFLETGLRPAEIQLIKMTALEQIISSHVPIADNSMFHSSACCTEQHADAPFIQSLAITSCNSQFVMLLKKSLKVP
jgi:hypothetical protein